MNSIIQIESRNVGEVAVQTVNARDLHAFLEVGKVFAAWIQERIAQYGFVESSDFAVFSDSGKNQTSERFPESESKGRGGHNRKEYAISLDMAKELAMVERNEKGTYLQKFRLKQ